MNVIASAVKFGLGPVGKLSSVINAVNDRTNDIKWYACGDEIDSGIFNNDIFEKSCWSKNEIILKKFIEDNNIQLAVVVLDPDIAIILEELGVKVFYIDSLPFLWTDSDIVPFDVTKYFAQKCVNMNERAKRIMSKVKNLEWVNPIVPLTNNQGRNNNYRVVINLGGMHSPYGNGEEYISLVVVNLLIELLRIYNKDEILITCGTEACKAVKRILINNNLDNIKVATLKQGEFVEMIVKSDLFITSPGMTTIYESCGYNKETIVLPPQNLSQFYNIEFAKKLIKKLKTIYWNKTELTMDYLSKYLELGEEKVVEIIYDNIKNALDDEQYIKKLRKIIESTIKSKFEETKVIEFGKDGSEIIAEEIINCKQ